MVTTRTVETTIDPLSVLMLCTENTVTTSTTTTRARGKLLGPEGRMWSSNRQMTKEKFIDQFTQLPDPVTCQEYLKMVGGIENLLNLYQEICVEDGDYMNVLFDPQQPTRISRMNRSTHTWSVCWVDDEL